MEKGNRINIILILIFLVGLSLLLYPTVSDYWNSLHQSRAIAHYAEEVANLNNEEYDALLKAAEEYNQSLLAKSNYFHMTDAQQKQKEALLNVSGNGIIGYIEIPSINCSLPIYHGTDDAVLQIAVGHLDWSSLPIGGVSTHSVLSGHRGLPSARLFTDIDKLNQGDIFIIRVLDEMFTYEVDQILTVLPNQIDAMKIEKGKDYCTLVTCTPYGINSHRLLVRGHRIENDESTKTVRVTADAMQVDPMIVAPFAALPILFMLFLYLMMKTRKKKGKEKENA